MKRKPKPLKHEIARELGIVSLEREMYRRLAAEAIELLKFIEADPSQESSELHTRWMELGAGRIRRDGNLCGQDCPFLVNEGGEKYTCSHFYAFVRIDRDRDGNRVLRSRVCLAADDSGKNPDRK